MSPDDFKGNLDGVCGKDGSMDTEHGGGGETRGGSNPALHRVREKSHRKGTISGVEGVE